MKQIFLCLIGTLLLISTPALAVTPPAKFALTTNAFPNNMAMPTLYTCDGQDVSPELSWTNPPANTAAFALLINDVDAPGKVFYHWILYNLPKNLDNLPQAATLPVGTKVGKNNFDKEQYSGPCPPKGSTHHYIFTLYALDSAVTLPSGADGNQVLAALKGHIIEQTDMTGVYSRWVQ